MSSTVDNRIVEMQFNNKQFESGIQTSLRSLGQLEKGLQLKGAANGLSELDRATKSLSFQHLANSVDAIAGKFSALGIMGVTALQNIANQAYHTAERMVKSLTIDPIMAGFSEYETQINSIQTILANTQKDGTTLTDVTGALDELNAYADKTIYNFTEMTRNIGTFTAAGIKLDTATNAIQGIANLAAISGSNSQQASTAMYQLSQAMASGTVKLMDWNSVVNAGMGGQVFQDALKETSKAMTERAKALKSMNDSQIKAYKEEHNYTDEQIKAMKEYNVNIDKLIENKGSFRETLQEGWITTDVLTETLEKFTATTEGLTEEQIKANREMWAAKGYTEAQIDAIFEMGKTATDAATKVKTFTQLFDTLKEAAQSGWTQSWEILVGDFEEAKTLLTAISDEIGGIINDSAAVRNNLLQAWKDAGGRDDIIEGVKALYGLLKDLIEPARQAFKEIFPPITAEQLKAFTQGFEDFAKKLKVTPAIADRLKRTFKGFFALIDIGGQMLSALASGFVKVVGYIRPIAGHLIDMTASLGDFLVELSNTTRETGLFNTAMTKIGDVIRFVADKFMLLTAKGTELFGLLADVDLSGIEIKFEPLKTIAEAGAWAIDKLREAWAKALPYLVVAGAYIVKAFGGVASAVSGAVQDGTFSEVTSGGMFAALGIGITKLVKTLTNLGESAAGILDNLADVFDGVTGALEGMQNKLNAEALKSIAIAVAILTGALVVLSLVNQDNLGAGIASITTMFVELIGALALMNTALGKLKARNMTTAVTTMIGLASAILILAGAMAIMSTLDPNSIANALITVISLMGMMTLVVTKLGSGGTQMMKGAGNLIAFSIAIGILAASVKALGSMSIETLVAGLAGLGAVLLELGAFLAVSNFNAITMRSGIGLMAVAAAVLILSAAIRNLGSMDIEALGQGLSVMALSLAALVIAANALPAGLISAGVGLMAIASALVIIGAALHIMGNLDMNEMVIGLGTMAIALTEVVIAANLMTGSLAGAAAILVISAALVALGVALKILGSMSIGEAAKALITLAGSLYIIGVMSMLLTPLIPTILSLSGALLVFSAAAALGGVALIAIGAGLTAVGTGIAALVVGIVSAITAIGGGIVVLVEQIGAIVVAIANALASALPAIGEVITVALQVIVDIIVYAVNAICEALRAAGPSILEAVAALTALAVVSALLAPLAPAIVAVSAALAAFGLGCAAIAAGVALLAGSLALLGASGLVVAGAMTDMYNAIEGMSGLSLDAVKDQAKAFKSAGKEAAKSIVSGLKDGLKESSDEISGSITSELQNGVSGAVPGMTSALTSLMEAGRMAVVGSYGSFTSAGSNIIQRMVAGLESVRNTATNTIAMVVSDMKIVAGGYKDSFYTIGGDIVRGIVNGINEHKYSAINAAKNLGEAVKNATKAAVDSNSPSKDFEDIGMWIDMGLANGLIKFSKLATNAAAQLGESTIQPVMTMTNGMISDLGSMGSALRGTADLASSLDSNITSEQYVTVNHTFDDLTVKGVNDRDEFIAVANYSVEDMLTELMRKGIRR